MQINLARWQWMNRVWLWRKEGSKRRDRRRANGGDRAGRERKEHGRRRRRWVVGCSHRQAHSSCNACWDALGSVLHNTITACSGVLCWAPLRSDYVLMSFVTFTLFWLCCIPLCVLSSPVLSICGTSPFHYFLNVLPTWSLSDLLQLLEQTISISGAFAVSSLLLWDLKCLLCLLQWFYVSSCWRHCCTNSLLSCTLKLEPLAWSFWLTGLPSLGLGDTSNHLVYPACLTALYGHTDVSGKL